MIADSNYCDGHIRGDQRPCPLCNYCDSRFPPTTASSPASFTSPSLFRNRRPAHTCHRRWLLRGRSLMHECRGIAASRRQPRWALDASQTPWNLGRRNPHADRGARRMGPKASECNGTHGGPWKPPSRAQSSAHPSRGLRGLADWPKAREHRRWFLRGR